MTSVSYAQYTISMSAVLYNLVMAKRTGISGNEIATQILVALLGFILSLVLHEAFHIAMHWQYIQHISLFPPGGVIARVDVALPPGYDLEAEEMVAYGITMIVMIITIIIMYKIRDTNDTRSAGEMLFPKQKDMQKLSPSQMLKLSGLDEIGTAYEKPRRKSPPKRSASK